MKKIDNNKMASTTGGLKCGWVGILAVVAYSSVPGAIIAASTGLNDEIVRCWNS